MSREVVFAVYDSSGNYLGYKADSDWTVSPERKYAKHHPIEKAEPNSTLFRTLHKVFDQEKKPGEMALCNFDSLYIIIENPDTKDPLGGFNISPKTKPPTT